ncbi:ABC transporter permease [Roseobacter sp.]|uniref:ABC transporter permease n=1 Tax=Roseobacter sp. TaxID=1907202 RepID=UPI00329694D5
MSLQLIRRDIASRGAMIAVPLIALALTCVVSLILFAALGKPAGVALHALLLKPFLSWYSFSEVLLKMAPLLLIAQGLAIGFRANIFNIGAEGQFIIGAACASALPVYFPDGNFPLMLPAMILAGAIGGMLFALIAAALRTKFAASEIIVTLMLSLIAVQILNYLLLGPWKDPRGFNFPQSVMFPNNALLPILFDGTRTNISLIFAVVASLMAYLMMQRHFLGFQLRTAGLAPKAAVYAGFSTHKMIWLSLGLGGLAAGIAGASEVAGPLGQLQRSVASGYGYAAIIVAYVGRLNPIGIIASSFLISVIYIGGDSATVTAGLPVAAVEVFQGLLLVFYLATFTLIRYRITWTRRPLT